MQLKKQYESDNLKIYAPDSLKFMINDIVENFNNNYIKILKFYHLECYNQYRINLFDDLQKFRNFIIFDMRNGNDTLPDYARGTYDKGMCNQFIEFKKDEKGVYIVNDNKIEYISEKAYRRKIVTPIHELVHIIYPNNIIHGNVELRVVWIDEGLAQNLSGEYNHLDTNFNEFVKFYKNIKTETKIIPKLKGIKHGKDFRNENYDLYKLSYLAVRYLFEIMSQDEIYDIIMDYDKSNEIGEHIMKDMFEYYDKLIDRG